jgi:hypothetical protein
LLRPRVRLHRPVWQIDSIGVKAVALGERM